MTSLSDKVAGILPMLESEGKVYLFALAEREDIDRWDVVLSADWSDNHWEKAVRLIASLLEPRLTPQEKVLIARVAVVPSSDPRVQEMPDSLDGVTPGDKKVIPATLLGSDVRRAFIFRAQHAPPVRLPEAALGSVAAHP